MDDKNAGFDGFSDFEVNNIGLTSETDSYTDCEGRNSRAKIAQVRNGQVQANNEQKKYAKYQLLERITSARSWIGSTQLKKHLEGHTDWANYGSTTSRSRTVDNWLKEYRELADSSQLFVYKAQANKAYLYKGAKHERMTVETACLMLLAERLLDQVLPAAYLESTLTDQLRAARQRLAEHKQRSGQSGDAINQLVKRIAVVQRGYSLLRKSPGYEFTAEVTSAILRRRCLDVRYNGKDTRRLHPYGLILREPKLYLLAVDEKRIDTEANKPRLYVCSRFDTVAIAARTNNVPEDFSVDSWTEQRGFDIPLSIDGEPDHFQLVLRVHADGAGHLLRDLADFPLHDRQRIEEDPDGGLRVIVPEAQATVSLLEWILGRQQQIEVLGPPAFRQHVAKTIEAMLQRYQQ